MREMRKERQLPQLLLYNRERDCTDKLVGNQCYTTVSCFKPTDVSSGIESVSALHVLLVLDKLLLPKLLLLPTAWMSAGTESQDELANRELFSLATAFCMQFIHCLLSCSSLVWRVCEEPSGRKSVIRNAHLSTTNKKVTLINAAMRRLSRTIIAKGKKFIDPFFNSLPSLVLKKSGRFLS